MVQVKLNVASLPIRYTASTVPMEKIWPYLHCKRKHSYLYSLVGSIYSFFIKFWWSYIAHKWIERKGLWWNRSSAQTCSTWSISLFHDVTRWGDRLGQSPYIMCALPPVWGLPCVSASNLSLSKLYEYESVGTSWFTERKYSAPRSDPNTKSWTIVNVNRTKLSTNFWARHIRVQFVLLLSNSLPSFGNSVFSAKIESASSENLEKNCDWVKKKRKLTAIGYKSSTCTTHEQISSIYGFCGL